MEKSKSGYSLHLNGWELMDDESMLYWKQLPIGQLLPIQHGFVIHAVLEATARWARLHRHHLAGYDAE